MLGHQIGKQQRALIRNEIAFSIKNVVVNANLKNGKFTGP